MTWTWPSGCSNISQTTSWLANSLNCLHVWTLGSWTVLCNSLCERVVSSNSSNIVVLAKSLFPLVLAARPWGLEDFFFLNNKTKQQKKHSYPGLIFFFILSVVPSWPDNCQRAFGAPSQYSTMQSKLVFDLWNYWELKFLFLDQSSSSPI